MATRTEALVLQMSADIRKMEKALNTARAQTNRQLGVIEKRFDTMNGRIANSMNGLGGLVGRSIAAIGIAAAVRETVQYADAWTTARNRLAAAGVAASDLAATQNRLVQLSLATRTGLSDTVDVYARLMQATQGVSRSQEDLFRATTIINQAFKAGGAAASEQQSAILQLGQALGSGVLQGDELRSIRENAPLLARAIAREFGVTTAELKKLGAEGKLTTERVFRGIINAGEEIGATFATTRATVSDSFANIGTVMTQFIGTLDQAVGSSSTFQTIMDAVSKSIQGVTKSIQENQATAPGAYFSGLALRMRDAISATVPVVGNSAISPTINSGGTSDAAESLREIQKALVDIERANQKTGAAQKTRTIGNLKALKDELQAYTALIEAEREAKVAAQSKELIQGGLGWRQMQKDIDFIDLQLAKAVEFQKALTGQIGLAEAADPGAFLEDVSEGVKKVSRSFEEGTWTAYASDLEKVVQELGEIVTAHGDLSVAITEAQTAAAQAIANDDGSDAALQRIESTTKAVADLKAKARELNLPRAAVQSLLDYANATKDVGTAFERLAQLTTIIGETDASLVADSLRAIAQQATDAVAVGGDRIRAEFLAKIREIETARKAAEAAGQTDFSIFDRASDQAFEDRAQALFDIDNAEQFATIFKDTLSVDDAMREWEEAFKDADFTYAGAEFERVMQDSVKNALKNGITTGDWGDALRSILADAITSALDASLDQLGAWIANLLNGTNSNTNALGMLAGAVGGAFFGTPTAAGAGAAGAMTGGLGKLGAPMGTLMTPAATNNLSAGKVAGPQMIDASMKFYGPVDSTTLPEIERMMNAKIGRVVDAMPTMVQGINLTGRRFKKPGFR